MQLFVNPETEIQQNIKKSYSHIALSIIPLKLHW